MKIAINAWFGDKPWVGSGQYLKYLVPALLEADPELEINLISPQPVEVPAKYPEQRLKSHLRPTPLGNQASNLAKVWFEQITFPRACRALGVDLAHVPYFGYFDLYGHVVHQC